MRAHRVAAAGALALAALARRAEAQAEVRPWGTIEGMRIEGQRVPFELRLCTVSASGEVTAQSWKERQHPTFTRSGTTRSVATRLRSLAISESVDSTRAGKATVRVRFTADSGASADAGALCVLLPRREWGGARVVRAGIDATMVGVIAARRSLRLSFDRPIHVAVEDSARSGGDIRLVATVLPAGAAEGTSADITVHLGVTSAIDHTPVTIALDTSHPGPAFAGMGGNFRIQSPRDSAVIAYNLANIRVAWGRVELPWRSWQPNDSAPPDSLDPRVRAATAMARTLADRKIPFVLSVWFPPRWAVVGELPNARPPGGPPGNSLDSTKLAQIYASLGGYLLYMKRASGAEPALFSFNESDIGIDVWQTPAEHDAFIRGFGAWMAAHGLTTKMLAGDVSDATPVHFLDPLLADSAAWRYVGAVSYHSWRGWSDSLLTFWRDAARRIGVPLLVGEGSTDAGAWRYPAVFHEHSYAFEEAKLYVRMLDRSEPLSMLPWQLTSDYSILAGGGVFGDTTSALHPTERFFLVKQLADVPAGARHASARCNRPETSCAALLDPTSGAVAVHVVNDGAARAATITGLPASARELRVRVTDATRGMAELARVPVVGGKARLTLPAWSFTTLLTP